MSAVVSRLHELAQERKRLAKHNIEWDNHKRKRQQQPSKRRLVRRWIHSGANVDDEIEENSWRKEERHRCVQSRRGHVCAHSQGTCWLILVFLCLNFFLIFGVWYEKTTLFACFSPFSLFIFYFYVTIIFEIFGFFI